MATGRPLGRQGGYTYLMLLFVVAAAGLALASYGEAAQRTAERERRLQLEFVGNQFVLAMQSYVLATPAGSRRLPQRLEELVEDRRGPVSRRHLRQIYPDPYSQERVWGLLRRGDEIVGIYSKRVPEKVFVATDD